MDRAQTMAEWEPLRCVNTEMNEWRPRRSFLGTGCMEVFDAEQWAIGLALDVAIEKRDTLQVHGVMTVADCSD